MQESSLKKFVDRLQGDKLLKETERQAIYSLPFTLKKVGPSTFLRRPGELARKFGILVEGYVVEEKILPDGARQILSLRMAGDCIGINDIWMKRNLYAIKAITQSAILECDISAITSLLTSHSSLSHNFVCEALIDGFVAREWEISLGRRDAKARVAHLLCEFAIRSNVSAHEERNIFYEFPLRQTDIGDATGLTSVHVNRMMRALEVDGLIERDGRLIRFVDIEQLKIVAGFSPEYLSPLRW